MTKTDRSLEYFGTARTSRHPTPVTPDTGSEDTVRVPAQRLSLTGAPAQVRPSAAPPATAAAFQPGSLRLPTRGRSLRSRWLDLRHPGSSLVLIQPTVSFRSMLFIVTKYTQH